MAVLISHEGQGLCMQEIHLIPPRTQTHPRTVNPENYPTKQNKSDNGSAQ